MCKTRADGWTDKRTDERMNEPANRWPNDEENDDDNDDNNNNSDGPDVCGRLSSPIATFVVWRRTRRSWHADDARTPIGRCRRRRPGRRRGRLLITFIDVYRGNTRPANVGRRRAAPKTIGSRQWLSVWHCRTDGAIHSVSIERYRALPCKINANVKRLFLFLLKKFKFFLFFCSFQHFFFPITSH